MSEIKFVKFGSLESKYIKKEFAEIKDSDLVYIESDGRTSMTYIVTAINHEDEYNQDKKSTEHSAKVFKGGYYYENY